MHHNTPEYTLNTRTNSDRSEDTFYTTCGYTQDTPQYINTCLNTVAIQSWFMYCASVGRIQFCYTHTRTVLYVSQVSARNTWEIHLEIHVEYNARLCVFIGVTWILPEYSSNILKYTLATHKSHTVLYVSQVSAWNTWGIHLTIHTKYNARPCVYSLGAHLNTDSYTQVYMYLECVDCVYCECIQT